MASNFLSSFYSDCNHSLLTRPSVRIIVSQAIHMPTLEMMDSLKIKFQIKILNICNDFFYAHQYTIWVHWSQRENDKLQFEIFLKILGLRV